MCVEMSSLRGRKHLPSRLGYCRVSDHANVFALAT